ARCTAENTAFQLCARTPTGDFYSAPIACNPATVCKDSLTTNGINTATCAAPGDETNTFPGNEECDVSLSAARCGPSGVHFQLCTANPIADGSFLYGPYIPCAVGTICTPTTVNGVGSVVCQVAGIETPPPAYNTDPGWSGLVTSSQCDTSKAVSRCDPANPRGVQLCDVREGTRGFYTAPTYCPEGLVCTPLTVN
ncbi:hypothetical protein HK102_012538, partial [Quaeritorhiza haematococci]